MNKIRAEIGIVQNYYVRKTVSTVELVQPLRRSKSSFLMANNGRQLTAFSLFDFKKGVGVFFLYNQKEGRKKKIDMHCQIVIIRHNTKQ